MSRQSYAGYPPTQRSPSPPYRDEPSSEYTYPPFDPPSDPRYNAPLTYAYGGGQPITGPNRSSTIAPSLGGGRGSHYDSSASLLGGSRYDDKKSSRGGREGPMSDAQRETSELVTVPVLGAEYVFFSCPLRAHASPSPFAPLFASLLRFMN